jgi:hypothetical protein
MCEEEVIDLARIRPEQLRIYTSTIFSGERTLLNNLFPLVFGRLDQAWISKTGESLDKLELVRDVHDSFPWKGSDTRELVSSFVQYVIGQRNDWYQEAPDLRDIVILELKSFEIARVPDGMWSLASRPDLDSLNQLTVNELMELHFVVPASARFATFEYDVLSLRSVYNASLRIPKRGAVKESVYAFGGRSSKQHVVWLKLKRSIYDYLRGLGIEEPRSLRELAQVVINSYSEILNEDDRYQFQLFGQELERMLAAGVIAIPQVKYIQ